MAWADFGAGPGVWTDCDYEFAVVEAIDSGHLKIYAIDDSPRISRYDGDTLLPTFKAFPNWGLSIGDTVQLRYVPITDFMSVYARSAWVNPGNPDLYIMPLDLPTATPYYKNYGEFTVSDIQDDYLIVEHDSITLGPKLYQTKNDLYTYPYDWDSVGSYQFTAFVSKKVRELNLGSEQLAQILSDLCCAINERLSYWYYRESGTWKRQLIDWPINTGGTSQYPLPSDFLGLQYSESSGNSIFKIFSAMTAVNSNTPDSIYFPSEVSQIYSLFILLFGHYEYQQTKSDLRYMPFKVVKGYTPPLGSTSTWQSPEHSFYNNGVTSSIFYYDATLEAMTNCAKEINTAFIVEVDPDPFLTHTDVDNDFNYYRVRHTGCDNSLQQLRLQIFTPAYDVTYSGSPWSDYSVPETAYIQDTYLETDWRHELAYSSGKYLTYTGEISDKFYTFNQADFTNKAIESFYEPTFFFSLSSTSRWQNSFLWDVLKRKITNWHLYVCRYNAEGFQAFIKTGISDTYYGFGPTATEISFGQQAYLRAREATETLYNLNTDPYSFGDKQVLIGFDNTISAMYCNIFSKARIYYPELPVDLASVASYSVTLATYPGIFEVFRTRQLGWMEVSLQSCYLDSAADPATGFYKCEYSIDSLDSTIKSVMSYNHCGDSKVSGSGWIIGTRLYKNFSSSLYPQASTVSWFDPSVRVTYGGTVQVTVDLNQFLTYR